MGPAVVDLGYHYKRILNNNPIDQVLTLGSGSINVNEVRVGVGVRF
jgi:opacity protein-like surface antigen